MFVYNFSEIESTFPTPFWYCLTYMVWFITSHPWYGFCLLHKESHLHIPFSTDTSKTWLNLISTAQKALAIQQKIIIFKDLIMAAETLRLREIHNILQLPVFFFLFFSFFCQACQNFGMFVNTSKEFFFLIFQMILPKRVYMGWNFKKHWDQIFSCTCQIAHKLPKFLLGSSFQWAYGINRIQYN